MKKINDKGVALIFGYFVISALLTLSAGFALSTVNELNNARRYKDSATAFWTAEAGLNKFLADTNLLNTTNPQSFSVGNYSVTLTKTDASNKRTLVATSTAAGSTRDLQMEFPANPPPIFDNTMSSGGNITLSGLLGQISVYDKTRLTGSFSKSGAGTSAYFEDKVEGVASSSTTLTYPDSDNNGTADQFNDFVTFNRNLLSTYSPSEVLYIQTNSTTTITPSPALAGKKIIYVEGTSAGAADVNLIFGATWADNQNLTVITTGTLNYIQPLTVATNSKLNTIGWERYYEPSILLSTHKGVTYSHGSADYKELFAISTTIGSVIGKTGITANETIAHKKFYYDPALQGSVVPPGFEGLVTTSSSGYQSTPSTWKEI